MADGVAAQDLKAAEMARHRHLHARRRVSEPTNPLTPKAADIANFSPVLQRHRRRHRQMLDLLQRRQPANTRPPNRLWAPLPSALLLASH